MRTSVNFALINCAAVTLLAGCGASQPSIPSFTSMQNANRTPTRGTKVFTYTGEEQSFDVPNGVTEITITAMGASGASDGGSAYGVARGGKGGLIKATIFVKPADELAVYVGGSGVDGGFNGGAPGGGNSGSSAPGGYGGGASDVRTGAGSLQDRVVVAGGGGGGAAAGSEKKYRGGDGGEGGAAHAGKGDSGAGFSGTGGGEGGGGGRQDAAGRGGAGGRESGSGFLGGAGFSGTLGEGGSSAESANWAAGGGGGGGYYGGGGGGQGASHCSTYCNKITVAGGGGGGGGSSYVEKTAMHVVSHRGGAPFGDGKIVISW